LLTLPAIAIVRSFYPSPEEISTGGGEMSLILIAVMISAEFFFASQWLGEEGTAIFLTDLPTFLSISLTINHTIRQLLNSSSYNVLIFVVP
jgi:hypothetical protein